MKKRVAILLVMIMVMSFVGCGNERPSDSFKGENKYTQEDFIGVWVNEYDVLDSITLYENGKGEYYEHITDSSSSSSDFDWIFENGIIVISITNGKHEFKIFEENGNIFISEIEKEYIYPCFEGNTKFRYKGNEPIVARIGETVKTDSAEITIQNITFTKIVDTKNLEPSRSGITPEDDDMIYACFEFTITSYLKNEKNLDDICVISMDYNNGFIFGENMVGHYTEKDSFWGYRTYSRGGSSSGPALTISPLSTEEYRGCIECPIIVSEDKTSPIKFIIKLFSETNGYENVEIIVR